MAARTPASDGLIMNLVEMREARVEERVRCERVESVRDTKDTPEARNTPEALEAPEAREA